MSQNLYYAFIKSVFSTILLTQNKAFQSNPIQSGDCEKVETVDILDSTVTKFDLERGSQFTFAS